MGLSHQKTRQNRAFTTHINRINNDSAIACSVANPNMPNRNAKVASLVQIPDTVIGSMLTIVAIETKIITCQRVNGILRAIENRYTSK